MTAGTNDRSASSRSHRERSTRSASTVSPIKVDVVSTAAMMMFVIRRTTSASVRAKPPSSAFAVTRKETKSSSGSRRRWSRNPFSQRSKRSTSAAISSCIAALSRGESFLREFAQPGVFRRIGAVQAAFERTAVREGSLQRRQVLQLGLVRARKPVGISKDVERVLVSGDEPLVVLRAVEHRPLAPCHLEPGIRLPGLTRAIGSNATPFANGHPGLCAASLLDRFTTRRSCG
jgi:hypothetical protein